MRTDAFIEEEQAGTARFYGIRETLKGRSDKRLKDTGNTDMVGHGGKALALWYMSGDAWEIDPITLRDAGQLAGHPPAAAARSRRTPRWTRSPAR